MDLKVTGCEDVDWIHLAQDRNQSRALESIVMDHNGEFFDQLRDCLPTQGLLSMRLIIITTTTTTIQI
jgi:hypothetical protein